MNFQNLSNALGIGETQFIHSPYHFSTRGHVCMYAWIASSVTCDTLLAEGDAGDRYHVTM